MKALLVLVLALSLLGSRVDACSCPPPPSAKYAVSNATAVFVGRVVSIETLWQEGLGNREPRLFVVSIRVDRSWKGASAGQVVTVGTSGWLCTYPFEEKKDYLVYAYASDAQKSLGTNICTRTRRLSWAKADLDSLGRATSSQAWFSRWNPF